MVAGGSLRFLNWVLRRGFINKVMRKSRFQERRNGPCIYLWAEQTGHGVSFRARTCLLVYQRSSVDASSGPKKTKGDEQVSSERYHEVLMDHYKDLGLCSM